VTAGETKPARDVEDEPEFGRLGLSQALLRAVADAGYTRPTPIQSRAIPPALNGRDLVGCAQTGTGKTAAFTLPVLQLLDATAEDEPRLRALVLTPTRELAAQIGESFATYGRHLDIWHTVIFGGVSDKPQIEELRRGVDALIATPGRLLDLMSRGKVDLSHIELFVLDEADRMLDMGFLPDVRRVTQRLPQKRHTLFFSATMPPAIRALAEGLLRDPVSVNAAQVSAPAEGVEHQLYFVDKADKRKLLVDILKPSMAPTASCKCSTSRASMPRRYTETSPRTRVYAPWKGSALWTPRSSWQRTSRLAASTSRASLTSSTSICPTCRRRMCIASVARLVPEPRGSRSRSATPKSVRSWPTSND